MGSRSGASTPSEAIRVAHGGRTILSREATEALIEPDEPRAALGHDLTEREREILKLFSHGLANADIAGKLFLSEGTVRNYVSAILEKLDVDDRTQAAVLALRFGLVK